jgi:prephenate dehydrogenase
MKAGNMFDKIAIIGVGLIGGSIGLAVRTRRLCPKVVGVGRRQVSLDRAIQKSAIDKGTLSIEEGIKDADLIIIATPVEKVKENILQALNYAKKGAVIIDVNSTKQDILDTVNKHLREDIYFVGTHPMAGSERSGISSSETNLFNDTVCIVTPDGRTDRQALEKIKIFWQNLGAEVVFMPARVHDAMVSKISHLPHLLAYALCNTVSEKELAIAGSGFRDATRIAKSSPEMWAEIFIQNKKSLLKSITLFERNLRMLKTSILRGKKSVLGTKLKCAMKKRTALD